MAETQQETAAWRRQGPSRIARKCEELNDGSGNDIIASRLSRKEMNHFCDDIAVRIGDRRRRRVQTVSDDRFLARRRWTVHGEDTRSEADEGLLMAGTLNLVCEMLCTSY
jgi:hypothetical protein